MIFAVLTCLLAATSQVVGYESTDLQPGKVSRVIPNFAPLGTFPTLKDAIRFEPPEAFVGCQLVCDLDGKHLVYDVKSYDENETDYLLTTLHKGCRCFCALDGIPFRQTLWINNRKTTPVRLSTTGEVSGKYAKLMYGESKTQGTRRSNGFFTVEVILTDAEERRILHVENGRLSATSKRP